MTGQALTVVHPATGELLDLAVGETGPWDWTSEEQAEIDLDLRLEGEGYLERRAVWTGPAHGGGE